MQFRFATYNIHKGIGGVDRRYHPQRVIEAIRHCTPDVVFLQEVDDGVPRSRRDRQVDMLADALELSYRAFQPNVKLKQGRYGNAIISRFPLSDVHHVDLTIPPKKRHRALVAHCRVRNEEHTRTLVLFNVHLGLAGFERNLQLRRLLDSNILLRAHWTRGLSLRGTVTTCGGRWADALWSRPVFGPHADGTGRFPP